MKTKTTKTLAGDISGFVTNYVVGMALTFILGRLWKELNPMRRFILILTSATAGLIGVALTMAFFAFQLLGNNVVIPVVALFGLVSIPLTRNVLRYLHKFDPRLKD